MKLEEGIGGWKKNQEVGRSNTKLKEELESWKKDQKLKAEFGSWNKEQEVGKFKIK